MTDFIYIKRKMITVTFKYSELPLALNDFSFIYENVKMRMKQYGK